MRVLVRAPLGSTTGYGRDGLGLVKALVQRDHDVDVVPTSVTTPIPQEVANFLTFPPDGKYDLEIHHVPPVGTSPRSFAYTPAKRRVLWTMWEWDNFPSSVPFFDNAADNIRTYDDVVGYTQQTLDAFKSAGFISTEQSTHVVQGGYDPEGWMLPSSPLAVGKTGEVPDRSKARDTFTFAMVGVLSPRKNPYTVVKAFEQLKDMHGEDFDAVLILKTTPDNPLPMPEGVPGVVVVREMWDDAALRNFYWGIDCLINVSWGEGKDLPALEATTCGVPTILNDTPGHRGWNHPSIQKLIPVTPMALDKDFRGLYTDMKDVRTAMWEAYKNRVAIFNQTKQLANYVSRRATWDYRVEQLGKKLGLPL